MISYVGARSPQSGCRLQGNAGRMAAHLDTGYSIVFKHDPCSSLTHDHHPHRMRPPAKRRLQRISDPSVQARPVEPHSSIIIVFCNARHNTFIYFAEAHPARSDGFPPIRPHPCRIIRAPYIMYMGPGVTAGFGRSDTRPVFSYGSDPPPPASILQPCNIVLAGRLRSRNRCGPIIVPVLNRLQK